MVLDSDDMNARGQRVFPRRLGGGGVLPSSQPAGPVSVEGVSWLSVYGALVVFLVWGSQLFGATLIYRTGFEGHEGYQTNLSLTGQNGWVHEGTGGNGVVVEFIPGAGQSAYIGFGAPTGTDEFLNIWRPVNLAPVPTNLSVITFSVTMLIVDSSNGRRDDFRWSFYNTNANRLFTVDFDNVTEGINYALDNGAFVSTGFQFTRGAVHELTITLNFPRNRWQAALDGVALSGPCPSPRPMPRSIWGTLTPYGLCAPRAIQGTTTLFSITTNWPANRASPCRRCIPHPPARRAVTAVGGDGARHAQCH